MSKTEYSVFSIPEEFLLPSEMDDKFLEEFTKAGYMHDGHVTNGSFQCMLGVIKRLLKKANDKAQ